MSRFKRVSVPRELRALNIVALLLLASGSGFHIWSWLGLRGLGDYRAQPGGPSLAGLARFDYYWQLARIGTWLLWAGVAVALLSAAAALMLRRGGDAPV